MNSEDSNAAFNELLKRATEGDPNAQYLAGHHYRRGVCVPRDQFRATSWFIEAANLDHTEAQFILATCYLMGEGVPRSESQAFFWWRKAAELGHPQALARLGVCYERGEGVKQDAVEAYAFYKLAEKKIHLHPLLLINLEDSLSEAEIKAGLKRVAELQKKFGSRRRTK